MTNQEIIFRESLALMSAGIIAGSGIVGKFEDDQGIHEIELPEEIHTFAAWKMRGYIVKKGQHAIATFPIWKYAERRRNAESDDEQTEENAGGRMFLKKAFFFSRAQVEKIKS